MFCYDFLKILFCAKENFYVIFIYLLVYKNFLYLLLFFNFSVIFWTVVVVQWPSRRFHRRRPLARDRELVCLLEVRIEHGDPNPRRLTLQSVTLPTLPQAGWLLMDELLKSINNYQLVCWWDCAKKSEKIRLCKKKVQQASLNAPSI